MSYINFSISHRTPGLAADVHTYAAGFSREGGRLESASRTSSSRGPLPPITRSVQVTADLAAAGRGVLDAILAAGTVQDIVVDEADGAQPATVTWTTRFGGGGTATVDAAPAPMQDVLRAAALLEQAIDSAPLATPFRPHP